jgi:hypothetical protein
MRTDSQQRSRRWAAVIAAAVLATMAAPATARAQFEPQQARPAIGEKYHVEVAGTFWNPSLAGIVSSEQFGRVGDEIDFVGDLGFEQTRFRDVRFVVRPGRKHRFRFQYTPVTYTSETRLRRPIEFNGQRYSIDLPVASEFDWKVWRLGYEYDVYYTSRGFVGILFDVRHTRLYARLASPIVDEFTSATAPLPALGVVGRVYPVPEVAINFEVSGFHLPDVDPKYQANYFDWDIHGTFNVNEFVGLQVGWRRMTTYLAIETDQGDVKFQGLWFGAAVRY